MNKQPNLCQYVFLPKKPRMSKGKIASQVTKVAYLTAKKMQEYTPNEHLWIHECGMMTVVLQVKNQVALHNVKQYLTQEGIYYESYNDEGYTEVPAGTMTCIATVIIDREKDGWRFEKYKLFK